jgi:glutathionylspermidine synthase
VAPEAAALQRPNQALPERLRAAFDAALAALDPPGPLGLVTVASELEDLMQMAFLQRLLRDLPALRGRPVVLGDIDNLRPAGRGVRLTGRPVNVLYRYVPFEAMFGTPPFATIANAVSAGRLVLLNGLFGLLLQHKGLMAWLWAHRADPEFPPEERAAIRGHLPPTWYIGDTPPAEDRATLVAKQVFGREGEEVFLGEALSPAQWGELVRRGTYVAQRRIAVAPVRAGIATGSGATVRDGSVTVGAYTAGPRFAGYYSRFGGRIIDSHALWFATLIDPAGGPP